MNSISMNFYFNRKLVSLYRSRQDKIFIIFTLRSPKCKPRPTFMQETRSIKEIFSPIFTRGDKLASERLLLKKTKKKNAESCRRCFTADEKDNESILIRFVSPEFDARSSLTRSKVSVTDSWLKQGQESVPRLLKFAQF